MQILGFSILFIVITIATYLVMNIFYFKYRRAFFIPVFTTTISIVLILVLFRVPYETYMLGGKWINLLLGPAIVALAIPLYKQQELLKEHLYPILGGIVSGVFVGLLSGLLFAKLLGFSKEIVLTVLPKSITTPIAMQIASSIGGIASLATIFVMIAGFTGVLFGPFFLKWVKIDTPIGRGIGLGTSAHALGTSKAIELGEQEASMSSVAMTLSALFGSFIGPVIVWIFY